MEEQENTGVIQDVAAPESQAEQRPQSDKEINFAQIREKLERTEAEKRRQDQYLQNVERELEVIKSSLPKKEEPNPWDGLDPFGDDYGQKLAQGISKTIEEALTKTQQKMQNSPEERLKKARSSHSDFDDVVNDETLQHIQQNNPLVWDSIRTTKDPLKAAYQYIKDTTFYANRSAPKAPSDQDYLMSKNKEKPKHPSTAPKATAMKGIAGFGRLSKEEKDKIWSDHKRKMRGG